MNKAFADKKSTPENKKSPESASAKPKLRKKITLSYLENSGAYYLQRFAASQAQFRRVMDRKIKLSCRDHPDQDYESCTALLDQVIQKFSELSYLNDQAYTNGLVYSLTQRGFSRKRIELELGKKGIPRELAAELLPDYDPDHERAKALRYARRKKIGPFSTRENDQQRSLAALARGGFSYELSSDILAMPREQAEEAFANLPNE